MRLVPGVDVIKLFLEEIKIPEKGLLWCLNQHCENNAAIFKQNYSLKLFIAF